MKPQPWLFFTLMTTISWGVWGAVMEFPEKYGFPVTLGYSTWAIMMIPCALIVMARGGWKLDTDRRSILLGSTAGLLGAGGQLLLFNALTKGPAYIIFPVISLYPVLTILLSASILGERGGKRVWVGVVLALVAILLLSYQEPQGVAEGAGGMTWLVFAILIFIMWGVQAFVMKLSHNSMKAGSVFFYMAATAAALIPVALAMTDFSAPINWGFKGPVLSAGIQLLNALGALALVYALRHGKAIIVVPITALAPVITVILSLILYAVIPHSIVFAGIALAIMAIGLLSTSK